MLPQPKIPGVKLIHIPSTEREIAKALSRDPTHPGLHAALSSLNSKRHPHAANLVLLGTTGTGKSSTVNSLFGGELAATGDKESVSKQIVEYTIQVPLTDLGVQNSTLTVVDTPGFGDTSSAAFDAQLLASLHHYFERKHPNVLTCILLAVAFDDTRFAGANAPFVKMLKAVDSIKERHEVISNSSFVFVLTRFMNGTKEDRRDPRGRIKDFATTIKNFANIAEPTILLAENQAEDRDLERTEEGFFLLPNGEAFPYNIFKGIQQSILAIDAMGEAILRTVYKDVSKYGQPTTRTIDLVPPEDPLVKDCQRDLDKIVMKVDNPISNQLEETWGNIRGKFKDDQVLIDVQRTLYRQNILSLPDLPTNRLEIIQLVKNLPKDKHLAPLLREALGLQIPQLAPATQPGLCFNVWTDSILTHTIFKRSVSPTVSPLGFCVPSDLECIEYQETVNRCEFFDTRDSCLARRLENLGIMTPGQSLNAMGYDNFVGNFPLHNGYNLRVPRPGQLGIGNFTAVHEIRLFSLALPDYFDLPLTDQFVAAVQSLSNVPIMRSTGDRSVDDRFKAFLDTYGTHVVTSCYGGGTIEIEGICRNPLGSEPMAVQGWIEPALSFAVLKLFGAVDDGEEEEEGEMHDAYELLEARFDLSVTLSGYNYLNGDQALPDPREMRQWRESLLEESQILSGQLGLVPLTYFVEKVSPPVARKLEAAARSLYKIDMGSQNVARPTSSGSNRWRRALEPKRPVARYREPNPKKNSKCTVL